MLYSVNRSFLSFVTFCNFLYVRIIFITHVRETVWNIPKGYSDSKNSEKERQCKGQKKKGQEDIQLSTKHYRGKLTYCSPFASTCTHSVFRWGPCCSCF